MQEARLRLAALEVAQLEESKAQAKPVEPEVPQPKRLKRCRSRAARKQAVEPAAEGLSSGREEAEDQESGPAPSSGSGRGLKLGSLKSGLQPDYYDPAKEDAQNPFPEPSPLPKKARKSTDILILGNPPSPNLLEDFDGAAAPAAPVALMDMAGPDPDKNAVDQKTPDKNAMDSKTPDKNATHSKTPDKNAVLQQKTPDKNAVQQKTPDKNAVQQTPTRVPCSRPQTRLLCNRRLQTRVPSIR